MCAATSQAAMTRYSLVGSELQNISVESSKHTPGVVGLDQLRTGIWWPLPWASPIFFGCGRREDEMFPRFIVYGEFQSQFVTRAGGVLHEVVAVLSSRFDKKKSNCRRQNKIEKLFSANAKEKTSALNNETQGWDLSSLTRPVMLDLSKLGIPSLLSFPP